MVRASLQEHLSNNLSIKYHYGQSRFLSVIKKQLQKQI